MDHTYYNNIKSIERQKGAYLNSEKNCFFEKEIKLLNEKIGKLSILDLACNEGGLSKIYLKYGVVIGIDVNKEAVLKAKKNGVEAICGDVLEIDKIFQPRSFDIIIAGDIIEHIFNTSLFLKKARLVLKENGIILISTPNLLSLGRRLMALCGKNPYCEFSSDDNSINVGHIRYFTRSDLEYLLRKNGFSKVIIFSDVINFSINSLLFNKLGKILAIFFPGLGRELIAKAKK